jgi:hypothetical protein
MTKLQDNKFFNRSNASFLLVPLVGFLLWNSGVGLVVSLIISYLLFIFLSRQEVYSTLLAGCFLWLFDFLWLTMRSEQITNLKQYAILLFLGAIVVLVVYKIEEWLFFSGLSKMKKVKLLTLEKIKLLFLVLKNIKEYKNNLLIGLARLNIFRRQIKVVFWKFVKKTNEILRQGAKQYKIIFLIVVEKMKIIFLILVEKIKIVFKKYLILLKHYLRLSGLFILEKAEKKGIWFFVKILSLLILFICLSLFTKLALSTILIWVFLVYGVLFSRDGRVSASFAIFSLFLTMYNLLKKQELQAENMAIYAYYFLVISVIHSIFTLKKVENNDEESCG